MLLFNNLKMASRGKKPLTYFEETITSSQSWVAPANVTKLVSITGKGENGAAETSAVFTSSVNFPASTTTYTGAQCFGISVGPSYTTDRNSRITTFNSQLSSVTATTFTSISFYAGYYMWCTDQGVYLRYISTSNKYVKKIGSTVYYRTSSGTTGASTVGFGYTFSGGTPTSTIAPTYTFNNVDVTPNQSYSLTIASGGYITIGYYA